MTLRTTILVVDDLPIFRELASLSLAPIGRIVTASDDEAALELALRDPPQLILARFPPTGAGNVSLCEAVKQSPSLAHIPVVLVTPGDRPEQHAAAVRAGADDVLTRPLDRMCLLGTVRRLLEAPGARGLPRVALETPVRLAHEGAEAWGVARNLSRGGIYVETAYAATPQTEVQLEFPLPGMAAVLAPSARVVWVRIPTSRGAHGMGLRFLGLDGVSARSLEHFVYEHRDAAASPFPMEASQ